MFWTPSREAIAGPPFDHDWPPASIWVDFRPDPTLPGEVRDACRTLLDAGAGALIGEHVDDPTSHRPSIVAEAVTRHGVPVLSTVTGRHRSAAGHAAEIDALVRAGVTGIHCVTGDHPAARLGRRGPCEFTLDGTQLAHLAATAGARVSVAESPAAPPLDVRPRRLRSKQDAGAALAVLNHGGSVTDLIDFADRARAAGVTLDLVAPVPAVTDRRSAASLARFPGLVLPPGFLDRVVGAHDPRSAGVDMAAEMGAQILASGRFRGLDLSGSAADAGMSDRVRLMARIASEISRRLGR